MAAFNNRRRLLMLILLRRRQTRKKRPRFWVRRIFKERKLKGEFHVLVQETKLFDHQMFFKMFRMLPSKFEELLQLVAPLLTKPMARREPIPPEEMLCVTLRYLVTGDAFSTISASYRMSESSVGRIVKQTCRVIWEKLLEKGYLRCPSTEGEWKDVAASFEHYWDFPNCLGALDGKHVIIQCPPRGGSMYFNYKKFHSIVLMAVVNASYQFTMVDVGDYGRLSDGSVFASSHLGIAITNDRNPLNIPVTRKVGQFMLPYVFIGDDALPLRHNLMKPYSRVSLELFQKIANYRFSRARRIVENVFGIATARFRVFRRAIATNVDKAILITKAIVALHNFLMSDRIARNVYCPSNFVDHEGNLGINPGEWRNESISNALKDISSVSSNNYSRLAKEVRDNFKDYFNSKEGSVPWQMAMVTSTTNSFDMYT